MAGIYVHIPFCKQRCAYCDFYSTVQHHLIDAYVGAVVAEARMRHVDGEIKTMYLGGGTPSQLPVRQLRGLVDGLRDALDLSHVEEFTVEVNPDDVSPEFAVSLADMGVNRVSMGVQSFIDEELAVINRRHNAQGALDAIHALRSASIANISIDLIYGLPRQTIESWRKSVETALAVKPQHISAYNLSYEHGTRLWMMRERGEVVEADDKTCVEMYDLLTSLLGEAGYEHYEISNFSLPGFHSRHNSSYWDFTPYMGLGASAHSFDGKNRSYNPPSLTDYINCVSSGKLPGVVEETEWWEQYDEMVMVALRTSRGLLLEDVVRRFGNEAQKHLLLNAEQYIKSGQLTCSNGRIYIPESSFMVSDGIIRDLMW